MPGRSLLAIVAAGVLAAPYAAADNVTIAIQTTVLPVCRFSASSGPDSMSGVGVTVGGGTAGTASITRAITYSCTSGVAPAFTITAAASCVACGAPVVLSDNGGVGRGMGAGREQMLVVTGPVTTPVAFQTASLGVSLNDVSITVTP